MAIKQRTDKFMTRCNREMDVMVRLSLRAV